LVIKCLWFGLFGLRGLLGLCVFLQGRFYANLGDDDRIASVSGSQLFRAIYDRDLRNASHLALLLWECPQDKWCAGVTIDVFTVAKGSFKPCDLQAGRCLLIRNEFLLQHSAVRSISLGVI
jgi:hypothetical protein